ncbi:hypothetical protein MGG_15497 [Pyricularia oryzae 70-15]|uniref:Uncharacterized protein n=3 Tax=Pyricularia oryzae TaxID=318829 RepID=G4MXG0_PYRO7|nr:uncharacterized protein MGG_15497 [Pyricularia oryzae 70-15]EHA53490.1 hypothetical protein MGG_15497 [Pyricularia oryzae 70-15]ELQ35934.1 hypothetical protein OOU_Y34scaffold00679g17 [Pyricularia oryzae Y34]
MSSPSTKEKPSDLNPNLTSIARSTNPSRRISDGPAREPLGRHKHRNDPNPPDSFLVLGRLGNSLACDKAGGQLVVGEACTSLWAPLGSCGSSRCYPATATAVATAVGQGELLQAGLRGHGIAIRDEESLGATGELFDIELEGTGVLGQV